MKRTEFYLTALILVLSVGLAWGAVSDIFVLGDTPNPPSGYTYTKMTVYSSDRWTKKANMPTARAGLAAVVVNGKIYAIGGSNGSDLNTTEQYNPVTNKWTTKANMPTARSWLAAAEVNGKIYAIGGSSVDGSRKTEAYDPVTNKWTTKANMPDDRQGLAAVAVNGTIYAIGGAYEDYSYAVQEDTYEYNPATNKWTTKADMPTARGWLAAAEVNGMIYAIGGVNVNDKLLQTNAEYSPPVLFYIHRQD